MEFRTVSSFWGRPDVKCGDHVCVTRGRRSGAEAGKCVQLVFSASGIGAYAPHYEEDGQRDWGGDFLRDVGGKDTNLWF